MTDAPGSEGTFDASVNLSEDTGRHLLVKRRALYATIIYLLLFGLTR